MSHGTPPACMWVSSTNTALTPDAVVLRRGQEVGHLVGVEHAVVVGDGVELHGRVDGGGAHLVGDHVLACGR